MFILICWFSRVRRILCRNLIVWVSRVSRLLVIRFSR